MKQLSNLFGLMAMVTLFAVACRKDAVTTTSGTNSSNSTTDAFVTNSKDTAFSNAVVIKFEGSSVTVTNPYSASGVAAVVTGANVVVTSTITSPEINYIVSGTATDGSLKVYSDYKYTIVLNGVALTNADGAALNLQSSKKATMHVLNGTNNKLADGTTYSTGTEDQKGTVFAEGQLAFEGTGALSVSGNYKHAICSDDYISIDNGNITIAKAVSDGIHANDYFAMAAGTVNLTSSGDGIEAEEGYIAISGGTLNVTSVDDGIAASYTGTDATITPYVNITGGVITVTTSGEKGNAIKSEGPTTINNSQAMVLTTTGKGAKGIKTGKDFVLTNGGLTIKTSGAAYYNTTDADVVAPAGLNADGNVTITSGNISITSTGAGAKGISVDGTMNVNGGTLAITASGSAYAYSSTQSSEAKGIKTDGAFILNSGTITIAATDDGVKSEKSITVNGGNLNITKSTEGIESLAITLAGGTVNVVSTDDCLNATAGNGGEATDASLLTLSGATVTLSTTAGDDIDSNGSAVMTGGTVVAQGPSSSPELAIDVNGSFNISGGLLIASGPNSGNMIEATSTTSAQNTVLVKLSSSLTAGTLFTIQNASGTNLVTFAPLRNTYYVVFSSSGLVTGSTYKVYSGGSQSGGTNTNGWYNGATYTPGTLRGSFTISSRLTTVSL